MNIIKYILIKNYRNEWENNFSTTLINGINSANDELELIYEDILSKTKRAA